MTLEEAIKHCEEIAELKYDEGNEARLQEQDKYADECIDCAAEHRQLAEWLKELKKYREETDWTPISKDLPEELIPVNVTWVNHDPPSYYRADKDKWFVDTAVYCQGDWYWWDVILVDVLKEYGNSRATCIDSAIEIIAWKHLPEPWEGEQYDKG